MANRFRWRRRSDGASRVVLAEATPHPRADPPSLLLSRFDSCELSLRICRVSRARCRGSTRSPLSPAYCVYTAVTACYRRATSSLASGAPRSFSPLRSFAQFALFEPIPRISPGPPRTKHFDLSHAHNKHSCRVDDSSKIRQNRTQDISCNING